MLLHVGLGYTSGKDYSEGAWQQGFNNYVYFLPPNRLAWQVKERVDDKIEQLAPATQEGLGGG